VANASLKVQNLLLVREKITTLSFISLHFDEEQTIFFFPVQARQQEFVGSWHQIKAITVMNVSPLPQISSAIE